MYFRAARDAGRARARRLHQQVGRHELHGWENKRRRGATWIARARSASPTHSNKLVDMNCTAVQKRGALLNGRPQQRCAMKKQRMSASDCIDMYTTATTAQQDARVGLMEDPRQERAMQEHAQCKSNAADKLTTAVKKGGRAQWTAPAEMRDAKATHERIGLH